MKSSNLRHSLACSQNKGLREYQRRASWLQTSPFPHQRQRGRQVTARAGRQGKISAPETASSTKLSRLPVANHVFLGSWKADICRKGRNQRPAPQRRHRAHLSRRSRCTPRKPTGCGEVIKTQSTWDSMLAKHLVA